MSQISVREEHFCIVIKKDKWDLDSFDLQFDFNGPSCIWLHMNGKYTGYVGNSCGVRIL